MFTVLTDTLFLSHYVPPFISCSTTSLHQPSLPFQESEFSYQRRAVSHKKIFKQIRRCIQIIAFSRNLKKICFGSPNVSVITLYLPSRGVYHPEKAECIVYDCNAKYVGVSLNPFFLDTDLANQIVLVLTRFRKDQAVFCWRQREHALPNLRAKVSRRHVW